MLLERSWIWFHVLLYALLFALAVSCAGRRDVEWILDYAGKNIEAYPDSVYAMLNTLEKGELRSKGLRARYSLLYSMALDKTYRDITSDSIIAPAVEWYRRHGTPDERLKACYYMGVILRNADNREAAMEWYVKAEKFADRAEDDLAVGRLYKAECTIYEYIYDFGKALEYAKKAADRYLKAGDMEKYAGALGNILQESLILGQYDSCSVYLAKFRNHLDESSDEGKNTYFDALIQTGLKTGEGDVLASVERAKEMLPAEELNWATVAWAYMSQNQIDSAENAISRYPLYDPDYKEKSAYYLIWAYIKEARQEYHEALSFYKEYIRIEDRQDLDILSHDTKFVKERAYQEAIISRHRDAIVLSALVIVIILLAFTVVVLHMRRKKDMYEIMCSRLIMEKDALAATVSEMRNCTEAKKVINDRLALLNKFITAYIANDDRKDQEAYSEMKSLLAQKEKFICSTRISIENTYPGTIRYLKEKNLTEREIEYCCLYIIGLNGKEIGGYIGLQRHYVKYGTPIRRKLGLGEHDRNLGPYLADLVKSIDKKGNEI